MGLLTRAGLMVNFARLLYYLAGAMRRLYWDKDKLRRYQEKRLRAVIKYAYENVPFYHEKFRKFGLNPDDIKTLEDLSKIPITSKNELRRENPLRLVSVKVDVRDLKVVRTSGSTGEPFEVYINRAEDDWRKAIYMRANISDEVCPCGRVLPLMKVVEGKKDSFIVLSNGRIISPRAFVIAMRTFKWYSLVEQFRIVQKSLDHFEFLIKKKGDAVEESVIIRDLIRHFTDTFNMDDGININVRFVDEVMLGKSGKLASVISEVKI